MNGNQSTFQIIHPVLESLGSGWTYSHVFTIPGTYNYQCDPHAGMGMIGSATFNRFRHSFNFTWDN